MKRLRQFCAVSILAISATLSAFAGNINCGVVEPPPSEASASATNETINETSFVDPVTELTLNVLQSLLSLF